MTSNETSHAAGASAAARTTALIVVEAERGLLSVDGGERASWLNGVITCDTAAVAPEQAVFGLFLSKQGKIQTDLYVLVAGDRLLLATAPGTLAATHAELERMLVMEDVELRDVSAELAVIALHGPRSLELAERARGNAVTTGALDLTGLGGALLVVPRAELAAAVERLQKEGAALAHGDDWPSVRIAGGVGLFGVDYGPTDNPHEASLERRAIAWNKGCYLGQEAVFMQDARGKVKRRLVVLSSDEKRPVGAGEPIQRPSGERVGEVTSSVWSDTEHKLWALGRVASPDFQPGTAVVLAGARARVIGAAFGHDGLAGAPTAP